MFIQPKLSNINMNEQEEMIINTYKLSKRNNRLVKNIMYPLHSFPLQIIYY